MVESGSDWGRPWPAPAKLNLFLHVVGRRPDGYHELQSVFQFLDLADRLYFRVTDSGRVRRTTPLADVPEDQDLCVRAARLLQAETGTGAGVDILLEKILPLGGGLGGGSSDAATVLVALNRLWNAGLDTDRLVDLGLGLGADVPVFVRGFAAWAEGIGEKLVPIDLPESWFLVVAPPVTVSTAGIFSDPELTRDTPRIKIPDFLAGAGHNDCEPLVRQRFPEVDEVVTRLSAWGAARMTGTGACVFVAFPSESAAAAARAQLPAGWASFVTQGKNRSPLMARLANDA